MFLLSGAKAEEATRESRNTKQDWYAEMRRKKDEEREAEERKLVGYFIYLSDFILFMLPVFGMLGFVNL